MDQQKRRDQQVHEENNRKLKEMKEKEIMKLKMEISNTNNIIGNNTHKHNNTVMKNENIDNSIKQN